MENYKALSLEELREMVLNMDGDINGICELSDLLQSNGLRLCPRNVYKDTTSSEICTWNFGGGTCRKRYATCFKQYFKMKKEAAKRK